MVTSLLRFTPILFSALGTSIGFYFFSRIDNLVLLIIIFIVFKIIILFYFSFLEFNLILFNNNGNDDFRNLKFKFYCILVFSVGLSLGLSAANAGRNNVQFSLLPDEITAIEGVLTEDPRLVSGGKAMAIVDLKKISIMNSPDRKEDLIQVSASGELTVIFPQYSNEKLREYGRGATVYLEGNLFNSSGKENNFLFSADTMFVVKPAGKINQLRTDIRLRLIKLTEGKDWSGLTLALLLGIRDNLDSEFAELYRKAGCSYILALSGMHLAVITAIIAFLLKPFLGLKPASVFGAVIIILYCLLVGPLPSLYRAALMYLIGVVAILGFLPRHPLSILSLSFLIQICVTPQAGNQISFILSYLALFGIFIVGFSLYEIFAGKMPDFLLQPLSVSVGAFISTAGVTGSFFGYASPIGIIAGLVLIPLTTLYMILSILWLLFNVFTVENIFAIPLSFLYNLMDWIINIASRVPAIIVNNPIAFTLLSIALCITIIVAENNHRKNRFKLLP